MQLSSVPCVIAAALALALIGQASPIKEWLEPADINQLREGSRLSYVTVPKASQPRAERKGNDQSGINQSRAERKGNEPEANQSRAERKGNEPEANQPRAERKDTESEAN
ncbi:hypothetical protein MY11210_007527 [Beauveria gryllotalpidicola]